MCFVNDQYFRHAGKLYHSSSGDADCGADGTGTCRVGSWGGSGINSITRYVLAYLAPSTVSSTVAK